MPTETSSVPTVLPRCCTVTVNCVETLSGVTKVVSPGVATNGVTVTLFFPKKVTTVFNHRPLKCDDIFGYCLATTPTLSAFQSRLSNVLCKLILFGCPPLPLNGVTRGGPPRGGPPPSDATGHSVILAVAAST